VQVSSLVRRDRLAVLVGLSGVTAAAWLYLVVQAPRVMNRGVGTSGESMHEMARVQPWTGAYFGLMFLMWAVMMVAMMVPTAAPMALVYAAVARKARSDGRAVPPTFVFLSGYVLMWGLFALGATAAQYGLDRLAFLSPMLVSRSAVLGEVLLVAAGVYELTPYKHACLSNCRSPAHFISQHWRGGTAGAIRMGVEHGAYCLGCCSVLMGLLFVGGVMNLLWVAAIAVFILLEKTIPFGVLGGRLVGAAMILVGLLAVTGLVAIG
jgi:predicted metal-binding membrane protein